MPWRTCFPFGRYGCRSCSKRVEQSVDRVLARLDGRRLPVGDRCADLLELPAPVAQASPQTKIVVLSMHADPRYVREMLSIGAMGYLLKQSAFEEIADATRAVVRGQAYFSPEVAGIVAEQFRGGQEGGSDASPLSPRERQVLQLLAEGNSARSIAEKLHISVKTVETHRRHLMDKLGIDNVAGLTKYAVRAGLTEIDS